MIAIRGLAVAAIAGCAAIALAPVGSADPSRETFSVGFRHDAGTPAFDNYRSFAHRAERGPSITSGPRNISRWIDHACIEDLLDKLVVRFNRPRLAASHDRGTGVRADSSRTLAAR